MSSSEFEVDIDVDPRCRQLVLASGCLFAAGGVIIVAGTNLPVAARGVLLLLWVLTSFLEVRRYLTNMRRICGFRVSASGHVRILAPDGGVDTVELDTGTTVLRTLAWIRVRFADGSRHGELLSARRAECRSWHRLQLIWRLCREAFGHPGGA